MTVARMTFIVLVVVLAVLVIGAVVAVVSPSPFTKSGLLPDKSTKDAALPEDRANALPEAVATKVAQIQAQVKTINETPCGLSPHDVRYFPPKPGAPTGEKCYQNGELARFEVTKKYAVGGRKITYYFTPEGLVWSQEKEYDNDLEMDQKVGTASSKVKYISSYFSDSKLIHQERNSMFTKDADIYQKEAKRIQEELAVFKETI